MLKIIWLCSILVQVLDLNSTNNKLSKCEVQFEIVNAGIVVEGSLKAVVVQGYFDPEKINDSHINIAANPSTINTGISIRDKHLQRADYFNTATYPQIILVSQYFEKTGKNKFRGKFKLSIKDLTKDCEVNFSMKSYENQKRYEGIFTINRIDFEIGKSSLTLSDEVLIKFSIS
jgi:polyisoprenoid-binding protein YceI